MFWKKKTVPIPYDPAKEQPAVRRSICTGEMTAGFVERGTGEFRELMLLPGQKELETFCRDTGITPDGLKTIY